MKTKFYVLLAALVCAATVSAETYSGKCGDNLNWSLNTENGALVITGSGDMTSTSGWKDYVSYVQSVTIPEGLTDMPNAAFGNCTNLKSVVWNATWCSHFSAYNTAPFYDYGYNILKQITSFTFGPKVERIPAYLCNEMSSLTEIAIPATVTIIGRAAFDGCKGLTEVVLPEGLTAMGAYAFSSCSNLASVDIPTSLKEIYDYAFYATALTSIDLHDGITSIGNKAFAQCLLTEVTIPAGVTEMGEAPFSGCSKLTKVVWNATWCGHFSAYNTAPFYDYNYVTLKQITSFTFGENVQRIPAYLCNEMSSLTEIAIPATVTVIGKCAFDGCKGLTEVVLPEGLTAMGAYAFSTCSNLASVNIPTSLKEIYDYAFYATALTSIDLHDGITSIGAKAFAQCPFAEVTIPEGVTEMGEAPFSGCSNLTKVVWNATWCGHFSAYNTAPFYDYNYVTLKQITSFTFGEKVQRIPAYLCNEMSSLTEINIPATVTIIGKSAFYGCKGLTEVVLPEGLTAMGASAFSNCSNLASVNIPKSLKEIYSYAFSGTALPSIELHDGITYIGDRAFAQCPFTEVTIPAGVTDMGEAPFYGCSKLTKVVWNAVWCDHFSAYNTAPFYDYNYVTLKQITSFTFGPNVQRIPAYLCNEMSSLTEIAIPATVTVIGNRAFAYSGLKTIFNYASTPQSINANVFSGVDQVACSLYIPKSAMSLYEEAPVWKEFFRTPMDPIYKDLYETACDKFEWNEKVYTASQDVVETFKAKNGNDSIVTLHLTINYSNTGEETQFAVGSYEWNGTTYTESGDYQYTLTNAAGCDSVATLHLTITPVWKVTLVQPEHGTIVCLEDIILSMVPDQDELHFVAFPDEGYAFEAWIGCDEDGSLKVTENVTVSCTFVEDKPTAVSNQQSAIGSQKILRDGELLILHNGKMYNASGTEVK